MSVINNRRYSNRSGLSITRCLSLIISSLTMIVSIGMIGFGIMTLVEASYTSSIIGSFNLTGGTVIIIIVGIVTFGITPIGFYSIIINDSKLMVLHMLATFILSSICILSALMGYNLNKHVNNGTMGTYLNMTMREQYGDSSFSQVTYSWDRMHQQFQCCATESPNDWKISNWFKEQGEYPRFRIPDSCCASCSTMHEKYCVSFFVPPAIGSSNTTLSFDQKICLKASNNCLSADSSIADIEFCHSNNYVYNLSNEAFRYGIGCYEPLKKSIDYLSNRMFLYSFACFILLFLNSLTWFVVHEISDVSITNIRLSKL